MTLISFADMEDKFIKEVLEQEASWRPGAVLSTFSMAAGYAMGHGYKQGKAYMFAMDLMDKGLVFDD
ncbi:hypothetical protein [Vibrio parahaemolyticus]|uniref:hypothetical protein n=1 Tax=Vibrio parahaemolyticus TaxID=670 RepID=UPI0004181299|nr:hypothetical protein [Vibrio parahaemolyticus]KJR12946.1 hypothetical protein UF29_23315 [Vibrio parahaemolyticus]HCE2692026.1 hypothetical protein [Vibrio parahaemolyticus]HCE2916931.1 hypothetical protein [Vibrio parahaemolyticus]HCG8558857.1 hypothetical protein [Vibrio parahaemolyticus]HCH0056044.1 hypothetical protein [Vibrio parahaemolyticus]